MVIKNLENKIKLVLIICSLFLVGCVIISLGSIWTARGMVVLSGMCDHLSWQHLDSQGNGK